MTLAHLSDAGLVQRCRRGDEAAWRELVERYSRYVWAIARRAYGLSDAEAEDVFQETFTRVYEHLPRLRSDEAVRPWLAQVTRRTAVDHLRAVSREDLVGEQPEPTERDDMVERLSDAMAVRSAMAALPDHCREVLDRFFTRDESYETISAAVGIPSGTIASRISRCLGRLRETLSSAAGSVRA